MASLSEQSPSYWLATTSATTYPPLATGVSADVAVIGAGIVGITAAFLLKRAGRSVVLVEARRAAAQVTGGTTAKVTSQHSLIYAELAKKFSEETARIYGESNQAGLELVASLVREHNIDCDFERKAAYTYSERQDNVETLQVEAEAAARAGLPADFVRTAPISIPLAGAVRFDNQAQFHPRKYLLHLLREIPGGDSHVFEGTRVTDIEEGSPCRIKTDKGEFTARDVIVATNLPILDRGTFFTVNHPIAHACLAARIPASAAPDGMFISIDEPSFSIRTQPDSDGLIAIVTGPRYKTGQGDPDQACRQAEDWVRRHFKAESVPYRWANEDYMPVDSLPYIGRIDSSASHVWVATGLNAWGMTMGTMAAMLLADCIQGKHNPWLSTFDSTRKRPEPSATEFAIQNLNVAKEWLKSKLFPTPRRTADDLVPGQGTIVAGSEGDIAAYRDETGMVHAFSASCTHQGCTVAWNSVAKTWDCPCHGSRFDRQGRVLYGPAVRDLEPRRLPQLHRKAS